MNKVIINKVDVSECGFYHPEYDNYCHIALAFSENYGERLECKDNPNCYYKQLQRLKEEKQELSIEIVSLTSKLFTLEKSRNDLSQGINKLYKALQEIREIAGLIANTNCNYVIEADNIIKKINEVIGAE